MKCNYSLLCFNKRHFFNLELLKTYIILEKKNDNNIFFDRLVIQAQNPSRP